MSIRSNRSVLDYENEDSLRKALLGVQVNGNNMVGEHSNSEFANTVTCSADMPLSLDLDWVLPTYDPETTEAQSMTEELKRLQVLKSYLVLDSENEVAFERITSIASRVFAVPIAVISLIDLGRQWFKSSCGLGEVRETPRKVAFCTHTILSKHNKLVVLDATTDVRFKDNPLVTGPPDVRFYAGAPLLSPEGYKLGTLCIIDRKPWQDFSEEQFAILHDLADMAVDALVSRRQRLHAQESPAALIAYTANDLMQPLTGVQLSLSLIKEDKDFLQKIDGQKLELLTTASTCADLMVRICETTISSLRRGPSEMCSSINDPQHSCANTHLITKIDDLVKNLNTIIEPIPKKVPLIIRVDPAVPPMILCDDLKLFRSALNLLTSATSRTKQGFIQFSIFPSACDKELVFECEDTAENIPTEAYQELFVPCEPGDGSLRMCLSCVASLISSLDGSYGFRPRHAEGHTFKTGSTFWFSVPLFACNNLGNGAGSNSQAAGVCACGVPRSPIKSYSKDPVIPRRNRRSASSNSISSSRLQVIVDDPIQASMLQSSCLASVFDASIRLDNDSVIPVHDISQETTNPVGVRAVDDRTTLSHRSSGGAAARASFHESSCANLLAESQPTRQSRIARALVVDDSLVVRKSLAMALSKFGYKVTQAENGLKGLEKLTDCMYDLVLCDFLMPVMDGLDCVKQYRLWEEKNRHSFRQLIVGISAHADSSVATQGLEAGMDDFRPKPIGIKILAELIESDAVRQSTRLLDDLESLPQHTSLNPNISDAALGSEQAPQLWGGYSSSTTPGSNPQHSPHENEEMNCLIAIDKLTQTFNEVVTQMKAYGWKVVVVHDGADALRLMQMRNWDAVVMDGELPVLDGTQCMMQFRAWEHENRVNRQKKTFFVSDSDIPSPIDATYIVQPPCGFDFVLRKPVVWKDLKYLLDHSSKDTSMDIVIKKSW